MVRLLATKAGLACPASMGSGAEDALGRDVSGVSGVLSRRGRFGNDAILVGTTFGVDVDGPVFDGGVWAEVPVDDLGLLSIVGVKPVILKTSDMDLVRLLEASPSESSSN